MRKIYWGAAIAVCLIVSAIFFGLGTKEHSEKEIVLASSRDLIPGENEPYYCSSILKVWESLVSVSASGEIVPALAEDWVADSGKTEWTFRLKKNVVFHDGTVFDAHAVMKNFNRIRNMGYKASNFYGFRCEDIYPNLQDVVLQDDYTIKLIFSKAFPMLIYRMAGWGSAMFSPKCFDEKTGTFTGYAQGTGPFKIVDWSPGNQIILERFDGYHSELAKSERIRIRTIPSAEARYSALKTGEIQGVLDLGSLPPVMARELVKDGRFTVDAAQSTISHFLTFNGTRFPFNDQRMRQAVNLALNRDKIVEHFFCGYGIPTSSFLNSRNPFAVKYVSAQDLVTAQRLAQEVLRGRRHPVRMILSHYSTDRYPYKAIAECMQAELKSLGLDIKIVMADNLAIRKIKDKGDFDMTIGIRGLGHQDPTVLLYDYFSSSGGTNLISKFGYKNEVVDQCFAELEFANNIGERKKLYEKILEELIRYPAMAPLLEDMNLAVSSKKIQDYRATSYGVTLEKVCWRAKR